MKFCAQLSFVNPDHFLELAPLAEEVGWDTLMLSDHLVHHETIASRYPYGDTGERAWSPSTAWPDVWVATGMMAAVTKRLRFMQSVFVLPMRDPFVVAKALGTAARMSGYRVGLGVGLGWLREEFELLGTDFATRGRRSDEMIAVMRTLWSGRLVEHHGEFYDFPRLSMSPAVEGPLPIIVGGISPAALRRAAALGDGWAPAYLSTEQIADGVAKIHALRRELGREPAELAVYAAPTDALDLAVYARMRDAGITHAMVSPVAASSRDGHVDIGAMLDPPLARLRDGLRRFADRVIAKLA